MARRSTVPGNPQPAKQTSPRTRRAAAPSDVSVPLAAAASPTAPSFDGAPATRQQPTPDQIRRRAYEIYMARGGRGGSPDADWLQAERELRARG